VTLDELQLRDRRIDELDALGRGRTRDQDHELVRLQLARDAYWRRMPLALANARRHASEIEAYARQHSLSLDGIAA
jgi:hypothetical protein